MALRITRQIVEILSDPPPDSNPAESILTLSDTASTTYSLNKSGESSLSLSDQAVVNKSQFVEASSVLSLSVSADIDDGIEVSAESILSLGSEASILYEGEDSLNLTQSADAVLSRSRDALSELLMDQLAAVNIAATRSAVSVLQTTTLVLAPNGIDVIEQYTGLNVLASVVSNRSRSLTSQLNLAHSANVVHLKASAIEVSAESVLTLAQEGQLSIPVGAESTLSLTQSSVVNKGKGLISSLDITHSASVTLERTRPCESVLSFKQSCSYILVRDKNRFIYTPFVGGGDDGPTPPPSTLQGPYPGVTASFALIYPATGVATDTVELRAPNLGNQDILELTRINRETRGGTLIVFANPIWPKVQRLVLDFTGLSQTEAEEVIRFMKDHLGEQIKLSDWEQRLWQGVITTPGAAISHDNRKRYSFGFEFEGELCSL